LGGGRLEVQKKKKEEQNNNNIIYNPSIYF